jgi:signal transduction histidine kinase
LTIEARRDGTGAGIDRLEADLEGADARRAAAWSLFGRIVPYVAHDFRARLNGLVLNLELLQRAADGGAVDPARVRHYAERMAAEVREIERMLRAVVEPIRPDEPGSDRFDFRTMCADLVVLAESYARSRRIGVRSALPEVSLRVLGNREAVQHALTSLLIHAIDALPQGSRLSLSLHTERRLAIFTAAAFSAPEAGESTDSKPAGWIREPSRSAVESAREILAGHDARLFLSSEPRGEARLVVEAPLASPAP